MRWTTTGYMFGWHNMQERHLTGQHCFLPIARLMLQGTQILLTRRLALLPVIRLGAELTKQDTTAAASALVDPAAYP